MRSRELVLLLGDPMTTGTSAGGSPWTRRSIGLVIGLSFAFFATTLTAEAQPVSKVYRSAISAWIVALSVLALPEPRRIPADSAQPRICRRP